MLVTECKYVEKKNYNEICTWFEYVKTRKHIEYYYLYMFKRNLFEKVFPGKMSFWCLLVHITIILREKSFSFLKFLCFVFFFYKFGID